MALLLPRLLAKWLFGMMTKNPIIGILGTFPEEKSSFSLSCWHGTAVKLNGSHILALRIRDNYTLVESTDAAAPAHDAAAAAAAAAAAIANVKINAANTSSLLHKNKKEPEGPKFMH